MMARAALAPATRLLFGFHRFDSIWSQWQIYCHAATLLNEEG
jgi:hypothetical protein